MTMALALQPVRINFGMYSDCGGNTPNLRICCNTHCRSIIKMNEMLAVLSEFSISFIDRQSDAKATPNSSSCQGMWKIPVVVNVVVICWIALLIGIDTAEIGPVVCKSSSAECLSELTTAHKAFVSAYTLWVTSKPNKTMCLASLALCFRRKLSRGNAKVNQGNNRMAYLTTSRCSYTRLHSFFWRIEMLEESKHSVTGWWDDRNLIFSC